MAKLLVRLLLALLSMQYSSTLVMAGYNIQSYGAKSDGETDSTEALLSAWNAACSSAKPVTIDVPSGSFLIRPVTFSGPCSSEITIQIAGILVAPSSFSTDHSGGNGDWLLFEHVDGVSVYGGTIDGRGAALWACRAAGRSCPAAKRSLTFSNSKNIMISGLTSINSEFFHIVFNGCSGATVQAVKISAPATSPNTDGIHIEHSTAVTITATAIATGDDCVSIGPGSSNLWIERVNCGPGHGISIGSLGREYDEAGVSNVTVKSVVFSGTENGLRIKTWGRPSLGFVRGVVFEHAVMHNVHNPIIIDQDYCPNDNNCPDQSSGVKISEVRYSDIQGTSATQVAVKFDCSSSNPCNGIGLQDIKLTYDDKPAESACKHADGSSSGMVVPPSCL